MSLPKQPTAEQSRQWPAPDWETWRYVPKAELWEAVALSCDVDPEALKYVGVFDPELLGFDHPLEFKRRLKIARASIGKGGTLGVVDMAPSDYCHKIRLDEFSGWANSHGWELPGMFPRARQQSKEQSDQPLSTRRRRTLLIIIAAFCKHAGIDPGARGAAQRIKKMTQSLGAPIDDETIAKALAEIPDALESRMK